MMKPMQFSNLLEKFFAKDEGRRKEAIGKSGKSLPTFLEQHSVDQLDKNGKPILLGEVYGQYRENADFNEIPDIVKDATVAIEDERMGITGRDASAGHGVVEDLLDGAS